MEFGLDDSFSWGVSSSSYQTEGGWNADGKGESIWDEFSKRKGKIFEKQNGNISCDFHSLFTNDISLMRKLNIPNFRFSISWSRIFPDGTGKVNQSGIDFYNRVIDFCLEMNIEPWVTLYHWDLPLALEKKGGWTNRNIIDWFGNYVELCVRSFGDRVKHWMVLNEPMVFTGAGYFLGVHAPGRRGLMSFLASVHHAALCQAEGSRIIRSLQASAHIGTTFSSSYVQPNSYSSKDIKASLKVDALLNRMFVEPLAGMGYPTKELSFLKLMEFYIKEGDEQKLAFDMDFIGVQNYTREIIKHSPFIPFLKGKPIKAENRNVEITDMKWEVYPESMYHILHKFSQYTAFKEIIVTENGAAFPDEFENNSIHDTQRIQFLDKNIQQMLKARNEGVNVNGYFVWSLTDNFEWAEGYKPRFGLVHINYETMKRTIKDSGFWYSRFIKDLVTFS